MVAYIQPPPRVCIGAAYTWRAAGLHNSLTAG
jgi:hypothetical protein